MFNGAQWHRLAHAHLRGFPGFVFGILILAMIPLYVASSVLIVRTQKPLITIPLPKIVKATQSKKADTPSESKPEQKAEQKLFPDIPDEIRPTFVRAQHNVALFQSYNEKQNDNDQESPVDTPDTNQTTDNTDSLDSDLPLPPDFDIFFDNETNETNDLLVAPTFTSINFDEPAEKPKQNSQLSEYLSSKQINFSTHDNIVITDTHAIITHDDDDFWATDTDNWFATGKSRPSPIKTVISFASEHNLQPAIYLASTNILDLETLIPQWESDGIKVITDLSEI